MFVRVRFALYSSTIAAGCISEFISNQITQYAYCMSSVRQPNSTKMVGSLWRLSSQKIRSLSHLYSSTISNTNWQTTVSSSLIFKSSYKYNLLFCITIFHGENCQIALIVKPLMLVKKDMEGPSHAHAENSTLLQVTRFSDRLHFLL